ncbi:MAG TPA: hypothetical protein VFD13_07790 [Candidatus Kapabacteria bacterium]|nr:hypothetical protein [Candidatus Kapabacteria bacterium]
MRTTSFCFFFCCLSAASLRAQSGPVTDTSHAALRKAESGQRNDSTLSFSPKAENGLWRRPQVQRNGGDLFYTNESERYYGSPNTLPELFEESGGPYPLVLSDEGYGRESFVSTSRTTEDIASMLIDGVLPTNSILNGVTLTDYFPLEVFNSIRFNSAAEGSAEEGADYAASNMADFTIERFRAPVPYSRIHFTEDLARDNSNFDGIFSINASRATNFAFGIHRHTSGSTPTPYDLTFNPRTDMWSLRGQMTVDHYLGTVPHDSTMTEAKLDSFYSTPVAQAKTLDFLLWGQYITAFSGLNGGIAPSDSIDIFDQVTAPVHDISTFDHRVRADALAELKIPFLAAARTKLSGFYSYESRRILSPDSTFPTFLSNVATGTRLGATLDQPMTLAIGDFLTSARLQGSAERIAKDSVYTFTRPLVESRLSAMASDSLALKSALRISLFGFARTIESNLSIANGSLSAAVLPSAGLSGSIGVTNAISFSTSYNYAKDRATLSPTPTATYQLRNLGGWMDAHFRFSRNDSLSIHAGFLDRHEPEGIVYSIPNDTVRTPPTFSSNDLHSQSFTIDLDAYLSKFHWSSAVTYFPKTVPHSAYTMTPALEGDLPSRFFGFAGIYFENEVKESNLRFIVGPRVRYYSQLDPQLTYDPASDYYVYRGYAYSQLATSIEPVPDARLLAPQFALDVLLSAEIDRRAQVNIELLNILGAPYYNVALYPRDGFHLRLDVTWAFID